MEDGLVLKYTNYDYITFHSVLILIVMEDGLVHLRVQNVRTFSNAS